MKLNITVLIPTYNEADNLKELLPLLSWVEEILVVDSFSTDSTASVAASFGAKVISRNYEGPAFQKNWAIEQATYEWMLILDADERPTAELCEEIKNLLYANGLKEPSLKKVLRKNTGLKKARLDKPFVRR